MTNFSKKLSIRWSDMDPNFHMRHSAYYDFGAQLRFEFFVQNGMTHKVMAEHHFGPILFREEALFKKEIHFDDDLEMNLLGTKLRRDGSRFSMRHEIWRGDDLCAKINVDGAFIDTQKRKLTTPAIAQEVMEQLQKSEDFVWLD